MNELTDTITFAQNFIEAIMVITIIFLILTIIADWRIFSKAGEQGWKSLIPIYNSYILYKICWKSEYFWITCGLGIAMELILKIEEPNMIISIISLIVVFGVLYMGATVCAKLAKSFGKGTGFAVGLFFLPTIYRLILGLGNAQYNKID